MSHRYLTQVSILIVCSLLVSSASGSPAGIGGPHGEYSMAYHGPETLTLYVVPDGSGQSFDRAFLPYGGYEDATITLTLLDGLDNPISNFPREDIWLESRDGGMVICSGGTNPDTNTDVNGMTVWANPLFAGGHSEAVTEVLVNGSTLDLTPGVNLNINSPDLNGDLVVNLSDVQIFSADFYSEYQFRSDFFRDGMINLSDLVPLSYAIGTACP